MGRRWDTSISQTIRTLAILGVGGSWDEAAAVNDHMESVRARLETVFGSRKKNKHEIDAEGREWRGPIVGAVVPAPWILAIKKAGGLGAAVRKGLETVR